MALVNSKFFGKDKNGGGSGGGTTKSTNIITRTTRSTEADKLTNAHSIWGNEFDGTQDVNGDLHIVNKTLDVKGDANFDAYVNDDSYIRFRGSESTELNSELQISKVDIDAVDLNLDASYSDDNNTIHIGKDGIELHGTNSIHSNNINVDVIDSETADVIVVEAPLRLKEGLDLSDQTLTVDTIYSKDITNDGEIKTQDLTVYGNAHFFNLIIDEVKHCGGSIILSPADFVVDAIGEGEDYTAGTQCAQYYITNSLTDTYHTVKLYQICEDKDTGQITENKWLPGDHVFCHTFNLQETTQKHYWTPVVAVEHNVEFVVNGRPQKCNMIEIVDTVTTNGTLVTTLPNGNCAVGDQIACLGSKNRTRQDAILICANKSFDAQVEAPCIVQYTKIDSYSLTDKQFSYMGKNGNRFRGSFVAENGMDFFDYLTDGLNRTPFIHCAYANSADGTKDFTKNRDAIENPKYIGFATTFNMSDEDLIASDYTWNKYFGDENDDNSSNGLMTIRERLYVNNKNDLYIDVAYSQRTLKPTDKIKVYLYTLDGRSSVYNVNDVGTDISGIQYYYLTERIQENWVAKSTSQQFVYARVVMLDANNVELDSHAFQVSWDAAAIFEITDKITARVSDCEGNISTLQQSANSILARVEAIENNSGGGSGSGGDGSLYTRVGQLEIRAGEIEAKAEQTTTNLNNVTGQLQETRNQVGDLQVKFDSIDLSVTDKVVGGNNLLDGTNFIDDVKDKWSVWNSNVEVSATGPNAECGSIAYDKNKGNSSSTYQDVIQQSMKGKLMPNTWYTLSFYAKGTSKFTTYVYPNVGDTTMEKHVDGKTSGKCGSDCSQSWVCEESGWVKHRMSFKTSSSITTETNCHFLIRTYKNSISGISQLKLEEGQTATAWDISSRDLESRISMSNNSIDMFVRDGLEKTGINIETGQISLNSANTTIDGTLNITNSGSGIIIMDDEGTPRVNIRKEAIGPLDAIDKSGYGEVRDSTTWDEFEKEGSLSHTFTFNMGGIESGQKISLFTPEFDNAFQFWTSTTGTTKNGLKTLNTVMTFDVKFQVKVGTIVQYEKDITKTIHSGNKFDLYRDLPWQVDPSFTAKTTGNAKIVITIKMSAANHIQAIVYAMNAGFLGGYHITVSLNVLCGWKKTVMTLTKLGTDGLYMSGEQANRYMYWGKSGWESVWSQGSVSFSSGLKLGSYNKPQQLYGTDLSGNADGMCWGSICGSISNTRQIISVQQIKSSHMASSITNIGSGKTYIWYKPNADEEFLRIDTGSHNFEGCWGRLVLILPDKYTLPNGKTIPVPYGKKYYIKVTGDNGCCITTETSGKHFMSSGSGDLRASWNCDRESAMVMFDGINWVHFSCG